VFVMVFLLLFMIHLFLAVAPVRFVWQVLMVDSPIVTLTNIVFVLVLVDRWLAGGGGLIRMSRECLSGST
jgi:hypothetical protein